MAKDNFKFVRKSSSCVDESTGMTCDQTVRLKNHQVALSYSELIRRIKYYDIETENEFEFITNNFKLSAIEIARRYKYR